MSLCVSHIRKKDKQVAARQMKRITAMIEVEHSMQLLSRKKILRGNPSHLTQGFGLAHYVQLHLNFGMKFN